jgi:ureidoacrylate peracid hydrolase
MHQTDIHPDIIDLIKQKRGGKLHVHDALEPARTALVVVDMQTAFLKPGLPSEVPMAREIAPTINRLARAFRASGGVVVWVYNTFTEAIFEEWSAFLGGTYAPETARAVAAQLMEGADGHPMWPEMDVRDEDVRVAKNRFSAFLPGAQLTSLQFCTRGRTRSSTITEPKPSDGRSIPDSRPDTRLRRVQRGRSRYGVGPPSLSSCGNPSHRREIQN